MTASSNNVSSKERLELADEVSDEIGHMIQRRKNGLSFGNLRLSERYIKCELEILVLFSLVGRCGNVYDLVAAFQGEKCILIEPNHVASQTVNGPRLHTGRDSDQQSMLVESVKLMDKPECVISSHVTLGIADDFLRSCIHSLYYSSGEGRCVFLGGLADRKVRVNTRRPSRSIDQLPRKMIQGTPEIVDGIADDQSYGVRDRLDIFDAQRSVLDFRLLLGGNCVGLGFAEGSNSNIQVSDVLFGPFNLGANSDQSVHRDGILSEFCC